MATDVISWRNDLGIRHLVYADIVPDLEHSISASATSLPVETGASISDHVVLGDEIVTFSIRQTQSPAAPDSPVPPPDISNRRFAAYAPKRITVRQSRRIEHNAAGVVSAGVRALSAVVPAVATVLTPLAGFDRINEVHEMLMRCILGSFEATIKFRGRYYTPMILESISLSYSADNVGSGLFKVSAKKVKKTTTLLATGLLEDPATLRARDLSAEGAAAKKAADAQRQAQIEKAKVDAQKGSLAAEATGWGA